MQMMMVDSGQPPYWSSTVLQSVASILFLLLGGTMMYHFTIVPALVEEGEGKGKGAVEHVSGGNSPPLEAEGQALKGESV